MLGECYTESLEIAEAERHRPAPRCTGGCVRKADETFTVVGLQQLHDRSETLLAGTLGQRQLLDRLGRSPGR